jgi:hypothetical protein
MSCERTNGSPAARHRLSRVRHCPARVPEVAESAPALSMTRVARACTSQPRRFAAELLHTNSQTGVLPSSKRKMTDAKALISPIRYCCR